MTQVITTTAVEESAHIFERSSGLDRMQAKTLAYWAVGTHALDSLRIYPLMVIHGESGTGKTATLEALMNISGNPAKPLVPGNRDTAVTIRNKMVVNSTLLIDEADKIGRADHVEVQI